MATGGPVEELCEEATCSVCLDYFKDPVTIVECGHNFCRGCLTQCWREAEASCPQCRRKAQPGNLLPDRQLANVVEIVKKLRLQDREGGDAKERVCEEHQEPLKLFCQTDQALICVVCDKSKEHKNHEVIPAGEASQVVKDKIFRNLEMLKTEREKILAHLAEVKNESQEMLKTAESERQKTVAEFRKLRQFLQEQENRLLAQVEEVEKEIARKRDEHLARLSEELFSFQSLIREMEGKHQQPVTDLLKDVRSTLQRGSPGSDLPCCSRCEQKEHLENPVAFPPELKWKLQGCCAIGPFLGGVRKQFQDMLVSVPVQMQKANVTLDPTTASKKLILSEDRRSIKDRMDNQGIPGVFYKYRCVLGREGFTRGCHFWDVSVGREDCWAVGVAQKPVWDGFSFTPEEGIWAVGKENGAFVERLYPPESLSKKLKRIRVCLNCDGGRVHFFDADAGTLLYAFSGAPFSGQTLYPYFAVNKKGHLSLCSLDS